MVYDRNGNLIQRTANGSSTQYTYDALDRLTSITHNGRTIVYTYDPFNRHLMKHIDGRIDLFAYHDQDEIGLWRADHSIQELRIASPTIRPSTIAIELNGTPYIPIHDLTVHIVTLLDFRLFNLKIVLIEIFIIMKMLYYQLQARIFIYKKFVVRNVKKNFLFNSVFIVHGIVVIRI